MQTVNSSDRKDRYQCDRIALTGEPGSREGEKRTGSRRGWERKKDDYGSGEEYADGDKNENGDRNKNEGTEIRALVKMRRGTGPGTKPGE